jgi:hypothetical protein
MHGDGESRVAGPSRLAWSLWVFLFLIESRLGLSSKKLPRKVEIEEHCRSIEKKLRGHACILRESSQKIPGTPY